MLESTNGQVSTFFVGAPPWHRLGHRFIEPPTTDEALDAAKMDWEVAMRPLFNEFNDRSTHQEIFRKDNGKVLGVVGPKYHPLQNTQAFGWFEPLIQEGILQYETAGVLQDGKKVWILAKAAGDPLEIARDDTVDRYVLLSNSHDGTLAIRIGFTPVRVVCWNTLSAAIGIEDSKLIRVRHTANAAQVLEKIRKIMSFADSTFQATAEQFRYLTKAQVNAADIRKYVNVVFDLKPEDERKREPAVIADVFHLFENGKGNDLPAIKGTAWALYNAVTERMTHHSGRSDEGRLNSLWFGPNATRNKVALEQAIKIVEAKAA
jgi:phage/plasmid-like protein (TIGR03299 family)